MTVGNLISLMSSENTSSFNSSDEVIYDTKALLEHYPTIFNKYTLDIAIKKENLPFFRIGHLRFFKKDSIDNWIKENNKPLTTIKLKGKNGTKNL